MVERLKKINKIIWVILTTAVFAIYLFCFFKQGYWHNVMHRNTFLYQQDDGSFVGSDNYATYRMDMEKVDDTTNISFIVDNTEKKYKLINDNNFLKLYENDILSAEGEIVQFGDGYTLKDKNGEIQLPDVGIYTQFDKPNEEDLFPSESELYYWSMEKTENRGNAVYLLVLIFTSVILILDILFPNLFFVLRHRLSVDGGEPSDFYRMGQIIGRVILGIIMVATVIMTFTVS